MHFRKGQMIQLKNTLEIKPEYRGKAGVIVEVYDNSLTVKLHRHNNTRVPKEDVARVL